MRIFDNIFWATISWFQAWTFPSSSYIVRYREISPDIVKYWATERSKVFHNYRQISSEFMTNFIEFQMLPQVPLVKQKLSWAKQVWWEPLILKRNKLKIKIGENKKSINKSYLGVHSGFSFTNIHESKDCRGRGRVLP